MLNEIEQKELQQIIRRKQYQGYYPRIKNFIREIADYKEIGVFHANTFDDLREEYLFNVLDVNGMKVLDIGANIGYFSFATIDRGGREVDAVESDEEGARLIELLSKMLEYQNKIKVKREIFDFTNQSQQKEYDLIFCLNVLHHTGRYFGNPEIDKLSAKTFMIDSLNRMAFNAQYCWFQMGYNWKGEESQPLFEKGVKQEVIDFIVRGTTGYWEVIDIVVIDRIIGKYTQINESNLMRFSDLGEFGNRPLFLLISKK